MFFRALYSYSNYLPIRKILFDFMKVNDSNTIISFI